MREGHAKMSKQVLVIAALEGPFGLQILRSCLYSTAIGSHFHDIKVILHSGRFLMFWCYRGTFS